MIGFGGALLSNWIQHSWTSIHMWGGCHPVERVPASELDAGHLLIEASSGKQLLVNVGFATWPDSLVAGARQSFVQQTDLALNLSCLKYRLDCHQMSHPDINDLQT